MTQCANRYKYIIQDENGKRFNVKFDHKHQLETWLNMEFKLHGKVYVVVK